MSRYFVTGATGTIGNQVLRYLQRWQKDVYWGCRENIIDKPGNLGNAILISRISAAVAKPFAILMCFF